MVKSCRVPDGFSGVKVRSHSGTMLLVYVGTIARFQNDDMRGLGVEWRIQVVNGTVRLGCSKARSVTLLSYFSVSDQLICLMTRRPQQPIQRDDPVKLTFFLAPRGRGREQLTPTQTASSVPSQLLRSASMTKDVLAVKTNFWIPWFDSWTIGIWDWIRLNIMCQVITFILEWCNAFLVLRNYMEQIAMLNQMPRRASRRFRIEGIHRVNTRVQEPCRGRKTSFPCAVDASESDCIAALVPLQGECWSERGNASFSSGSLPSRLSSSSMILKWVFRTVAVPLVGTCGSQAISIWWRSFDDGH